MRSQLSKFRWLTVNFLLSLAVLACTTAFAATLTVKETGAPLYARQDIESDPIVRLEKGESLSPMAESVAQEIWYMVRAKQGQIGWVRAVDVEVNNQVKETFKEKDAGSSSWAAVNADGQTFSGTWSVAPNSTNRSARGFWTLRDANGGTSLRGTWSAEMHSTGWNGTWRAVGEAGQGEHKGSWSAELTQSRNLRFADLFEAAAKDAIRGLWTGGSESGSWSIRTFK
jgi:hypothetical protein